MAAIEPEVRMEESTKEAQYQFLIDLEKQGLEQLGLMSSQVWHDDPRRLLFVLARYKFAAKMLAGQRKVLEVGCADAFGTRIVRQEVPEVVTSNLYSWVTASRVMVACVSVGGSCKLEEYAP